MQKVDHHRRIQISLLLNINKSHYIPKYYRWFYSRLVLSSTNSLIIDDNKDEDDDDECMFLGTKVGVGQKGAVPRLAGLRIAPLRTLDSAQRCL